MRRRWEVEVGFGVGLGAGHSNWRVLMKEGDKGPSGVTERKDARLPLEVHQDAARMEITNWQLDFKA